MGGSIETVSSLTAYIGSDAVGDFSGADHAETVQGIHERNNAAAMTASNTRALQCIISAPPSAAATLVFPWACVINCITLVRVRQSQPTPSGCELIGALGVGCATTDVGEQPKGAPAALYLGPAVPNRFNPTTRITYGIPVSAGRSRVVVDICDVLGRRVRSLVNRDEGPGEYRVTWDGKNDRGEPVASGVYFCGLTKGTRTLTRKAVLLR